MYLPTQTRFYPMRLPVTAPRPVAPAAGGYRTVRDAQTGQTCRLNPAQAAALDAGACAGCRCMWVGDVNRSPQSGHFVISTGAPAPAVISSAIAVQTSAPSIQPPASSPAASALATVSAPATPVSSPGASAGPAGGNTPPAPSSSFLGNLLGSPWFGSIPNWMVLGGVGLGIVLLRGGHR